MQQSCTYGSVRGAAGDRRPYRDETALGPSHRPRYLGWIESAKGEETKLRRVTEAMRLLARGKVLK